MKDFLVVGNGLAAHVLMHAFKKNNISFTTVGSSSLSNCSRVAAGIWNPVVFKRSTKSWMADELIPELIDFYTGCEAAFGKKIITFRPIIKPFTEDQEKQLWIKKSGTDLMGFTDPAIYTTVPAALKHCHILNGYGLVQQSGNLNVADFLDLSTAYFKDDFMAGVFDYHQLRVFPNKISYQSTEARNIIFCEGYRLKDNPYFSWIPLKPAKGEVLTIATSLPGFDNMVFNKNGFLMDVSPGIYKAGATYEWQELNELPTEKGFDELNAKLKDMISCTYSVIKHEAGIRPSSLDRRPLIGAHPQHKNLFAFNGLGTKGVMLAPYFAKNFVNFYLQKELLNKDIDLARFYHFYEA